MELLKLIKNRISTEWKKTFNDNVDILNRNARDQDQKIDVVNKRISNLVLQSGGESPTEVVDARVNNKGETFDTLESRLLAAENTHDTDIGQANTQISENKEQVDQLNTAVRQILGGFTETIEVYVSKNGSDAAGDGSETKPFKTIQVAVNSIPVITTGGVVIRIENGTYLEDVVIRNLSFVSFNIQPVDNVDTIDPSKSDLPVKIRSISFTACKGYCRVWGIQIIDTVNSPGYGINFEQSGYMAINRCKFAENTKSISDYTAVSANGSSKLNLYGNTVLINQNIGFQALLMGEINLDSTFSGSGNNVGALANAGTIRGTVPSGFATTPAKASNNGLIITKGTVL